MEEELEGWDSLGLINISDVSNTSINCDTTLYIKVIGDRTYYKVRLERCNNWGTKYYGVNFNYKHIPYITIDKDYQFTIPGLNKDQ